jgi:alpha-tubulin suppressor-like RCC1 family protein
VYRPSTWPRECRGGELLCYTCGSGNPEGDVVCWGRNHYGQCNVPATLSGNVLAVWCHLCRTTAVTREGRIVCWGGGSCNQCDAPVDIVVKIPLTILL